MSLCFLRHLFETSPVIWERSPKPKSNLPSPAFERHAWWVWFIVYLAVSADATTSSRNHSLDPSFERPSHFPSGFPCTLMMSRHSPCFRVRSVLLPLQSRWTFTWWMASRGPTSWRTHKNKVISQHLWVEQTVKSFFFLTQTDCFLMRRLTLNFFLASCSFFSRSFCSFFSTSCCFFPFLSCLCSAASLHRRREFGQQPSNPWHRL